eukprot:3184162-Rhodomonas_salina.3
MPKRADVGQLSRELIPTAAVVSGSTQSIWTDVSLSLAVRASRAVHAGNAVDGPVVGVECTRRTRERPRCALRAVAAPDALAVERGGRARAGHTVVPALAETSRSHKPRLVTEAPRIAARAVVAWRPTRLRTEHTRRADRAVDAPRGTVEARRTGRAVSNILAAGVRAVEARGARDFLGLARPYGAVVSRIAQLVHPHDGAFRAVVACRAVDAVCDGPCPGCVHEEALWARNHERRRLWAIMTRNAGVVEGRRVDLHSRWAIQPLRASLGYVQRCCRCRVAVAVVPSRADRALALAGGRVVSSTTWLPDLVASSRTKSTCRARLA